MCHYLVLRFERALSILLQEGTSDGPRGLEDGSKDLTVVFLDHCLGCFYCCDKTAWPEGT